MAIIDKIVSYWAFDEASGNALDAHAANALAENGGTIESEAGKVGTCRRIRSADTEDFRTSAHVAALEGGARDFGLCGWFRPDTDANHTLFGEWQASGNNRAFSGRYVAGATDRFTSVATADGSTTVTVTANNFGAPPALDGSAWYFYCLQHENGVGLRLSVNAGTEDTTAHATGIKVGVATLRFGVLESSTPANGAFDEWFFFDEILTDDERTWLYNSGNGRSYADIVAAGGTLDPVTPLGFGFSFGAFDIEGGSAPSEIVRMSGRFRCPILE